MGHRWSTQEEQPSPADRDVPTSPHLKLTVPLYGAFQESQNAFQQERQTSTIHPHHTEVSQSDLSVSFLVAPLEREPMLGPLSSCQVGNGGQHHLPCLQRVWM